MEGPTTRGELERLPLRAIVALGFRAVQGVRPLFVLPAQTRKTRKYCAALDKALLIACEFAAGKEIDGRYALRAFLGYERAEQAAHDMIYSEGPHAFTADAFRCAEDSTLKGAAIARAGAQLALAACRFTLATADQAELVPWITQMGPVPPRHESLADGIERMLHVLRDAPVNHNEYQKLLSLGVVPFPELGEPVDPTISGPLGPFRESRSNA
jgi:hypothetical protein